MKRFISDQGSALLLLAAAFIVCGVIGVGFFSNTRNHRSDYNRAEIQDSVSDSSETKKINMEHLIASIPEKNLSVYYDEKKSDHYWGIYVMKEDKGFEGIGYYPWTYSAYWADTYYPAKICLIQDGTQLFFKFTQIAQDETYRTEVHIIDLETMEEIPIQSPDEVIAKNLQTEVMDAETGEIRFVFQGQAFSEHLKPDYMNENLPEELWYDVLTDYQMEEDTLVYETFLSPAISFYIGDLKLKYVYLDGEYRVDSMNYTPRHFYYVPEKESQNENEVREAAYEKAVQVLREKYLFPNGRFADFGYWREISEENGYQVTDIDGDSRVELILNCPKMANSEKHMFYVFEYDVNTKEFREELVRHPMGVDFYDHGIVLARMLHSKQDGFWPYDVLRYEPETDTYELVRSVTVLYKDGEDFPKDQDLDGDGKVYSAYLLDLKTLEPADVEIMDSVQYEQWQKNLLSGGKKVALDFKGLSCD